METELAGWGGDVPHYKSTPHLCQAYLPAEIPHFHQYVSNNRRLVDLIQAKAAFNITRSQINVVEFFLGLILV